LESIFKSLNCTCRVILSFFLIVNFVLKIFADGFGLTGYQFTHGFSFHQGYRVGLNMGGRIGTTMWEHVMGVKIGSINKATINGFGVASAVVFEWRFTEVSGERTVGYQSGGLFELSIK